MSITFGSLLVMADTAACHDMASAAERPPGWERYRDRDFGMAFDFPAHIFSLKSAEQGSEGVVFSTLDDRARIRVFGFRNEANDTPRRYLRRIANPEQARFTYVRTTPRFFAASGTRDGMIFYRRCNFFGDDRSRRILGMASLPLPGSQVRVAELVQSRCDMGRQPHSGGHFLARA
jgi:hypothetical protein